MQRLNMAIIIAGLIIVVTVISFFATSYGDRPPVKPSITPTPNNVTQEDITLILDNVPDVRQSTDYTDGPSALQAILSYWGIDKGEYELTVSCLTDEANGTEPMNIVNASKGAGLLSYLKTNLTMAELNDSIERLIPVIVTLNDSGLHERYMVVIGLDDENVFLEDPAILGSRTVIPYEEFTNRWRYSGEDNQTYLRPGIFIVGESPAKYSKYVTAV